MRISMVIVLFVTMLATSSFGQDTLNRYDRLTKLEFQELLKYIDRFVPADLGDTVVIVRYSSQQLLNMQNQARTISFAKNGVDTTGLTSETLWTEKQLREVMADVAGFSVTFPRKLQKQWKKKGMSSVIIDDVKLHAGSQYRNKYWLKTIFVCDQESLEDDGWVISMKSYFYDPRTGKNFEVFLPVNHDLIEMAK